MLDWYLEISRLLREMRKKAYEALQALREDNQAVAKTINDYLKNDWNSLLRLWEPRFPVGELGCLGRHIHFGMANDYQDILARDIPQVEEKAESRLRQEFSAGHPIGFEGLLHPAILEHAYPQYYDGHLRDAVLNAIVVVFDLIRQRTDLQSDGDRLIGEALSLQHPLLVLSELDTESGRNDQAGFMQILQGAYKGIRNPKAHSLQHDLDEHKAAQYLVFASLLARRIADATDSKR
jgi:uncharacterized protein (TIGR02391 family)